MRFIAKRICISAVMLAATSILIFVVLRALPGDPILARLGARQGISGAMLERLRRSAGLDQPLTTQYAHWISGIFHGNLGTSYFSDRSVSSMVLSGLGVTVELTVVGVVLAVLIAIPAAILASNRPGGWLDRAISGLSSAGMAFPPFVAGILLILVFSVTLHWLPARGFVSLAQDPVENLRRIILPSISLAVGAAPLILRYLRAELVTALRALYTRTAAGKGASQRRVVGRHALPNAMLPTLTMVGLITGYTLGGSVVVEYVFGFSGLGALSVNAAFGRDYAVLQSTVLLISAMFIFVSLIVDISVWALDPRTRVSRG